MVILCKNDVMHACVFICITCMHISTYYMWYAFFRWFLLLFEIRRIKKCRKSSWKNSGKFEQGFFVHLSLIYQRMNEWFLCTVIFSDNYEYYDFKELPLLSFLKRNWSWPGGIKCFFSLSVCVWQPDLIWGKFKGRATIIKDS